MVEGPRDQYVMVLGDYYDDGNPKTETAEIIDITNTNECGSIPSLSVAVSDGTMAFYNGKVMYCSSKCHSYKPGDESWTELPNDVMSTFRRAAASSIIQDVWLISGGQVGRIDVSSTEYWDGVELRNGPDMPQTMDYHCQVTISKSEVFFHSTGIDPDDMLGRTFLLDWDQKTWTTLDPGTRTATFGTCGMVKTSDSGFEIVVADRGQSSIINLQTRQVNSSSNNLNCRVMMEKLMCRYGSL